MSKNAKANSAIDWVNLALMIIALILAIIIPFKLFLFSYAFLGPLHYLTEIKWLKDKNFFISAKVPIFWTFALFSVILSIYQIYKLIDFQLTTDLNEFFKKVALGGNALVLAAFVLAICMLFVKSLKDFFMALAFSLLSAASLHFFVPKGLIFVGLFLPTIIHVYLFTATFMIYGSRAQNSKLGLWTAIFLLLSPLVVYYIPINSEHFTISKVLLENYNSSSFFNVTKGIAYVLGIENVSQMRVISMIAIKIQIFIAFIYTYHYLNWFSKTSVIGWRSSVTKLSTIWILIVWGISVCIYIYDYKLGFTALFFLSFLHVFLEFPLNIKTIKSLL